MHGLHTSRETYKEGGGGGGGGSDTKGRKKRRRGKAEVISEHAALSGCGDGERAALHVSRGFYIAIGRKAQGRKSHW